MLICAIQASSGGGEDPGGESAQCLQRGSDRGDHLDPEDSDFDDDAVVGVADDAVGGVADDAVGGVADDAVVGVADDAVVGVGEDNKNCVAGLWCRGGQRTTLKSRAAPYLGD